MAFWKKLLITAVSILVLFLIGVYITLGYLNSYTQHGVTYSIPDLTGVNIKEIDEMLDSTDFRYEVIDSIWDRDMDKGVVIAQKPKPESEVKQGRKVYLTINARTRKRIKLHLDNVVSGSSTVRAAMDNLASYDVVIDSIHFVDHEYSGIVLGVMDMEGKELTSNDYVYTGSKLILKVGRKGDQKVVIDNYIGVNIVDAQKSLLGKQLNVSISDIQDGSCLGNIDSTQALVVKQVPEANEEINTGSVVSLIYSCDPEAVPD